MSLLSVRQTLEIPFSLGSVDLKDDGKFGHKDGTAKIPTEGVESLRLPAKAAAAEDTFCLCLTVSDTDVRNQLAVDRRDVERLASFSKGLLSTSVVG